MKAFKQINLKPEKRILFAYVSLLTVACMFILISPVFAHSELPRSLNHVNNFEAEKVAPEQFPATGISAKTNNLNNNIDSPLHQFHQTYLVKAFVENAGDTNRLRFNSQNTDYMLYILGYLNGYLDKNRSFEKSFRQDAENGIPE